MYVVRTSLKASVKKLSKKLKIWGGGCNNIFEWPLRLAKKLVIKLGIWKIIK